ncbi:hypothetical protein Tsp_15649 [Trichinella spiralis]|uniref:hypothetical protein n=1 Tax=Trichinella spiralis TaxID=6334 RepID=UPI0001EFEE00|nr:hypothetical protein Tsp_15649 [Trichinella spiralis]
MLFRLQIPIFQSPHFVKSSSVNFKMLFFIIFTCLHHATAYNITDDMITQWLDSMKKIDKFSSRQFELVLDFQIAADKSPLDRWTSLFVVFNWPRNLCTLNAKICLSTRFQADQASLSSWKL